MGYAPGLLAYLTEIPERRGQCPLIQETNPAPRGRLFSWLGNAQTFDFGQDLLQFGFGGLTGLGLF